MKRRKNDEESGKDLDPDALSNVTPVPNHMLLRFLVGTIAMLIIIVCDILRYIFAWIFLGLSSGPLMALSFVPALFMGWYMLIILQVARD